jgi:hypothetical protein
VESYSQVHKHLLNLVDDFNKPYLVISRNVSTAKIMQYQTMVLFMNQGLERVWKKMVLVIGLVMPVGREEYH